MIDWEYGRGFFDNGLRYQTTRVRMIRTQPYTGKLAELMRLPGFYIQKQNRREQK